jgi:LysM domain
MTDGKKPAKDGAPVAGGLGSVVGLGLLVVGVPLLLMSEGVGSPVGILLRLIRYPRSLLDALEHPVTESTIVHAVVLIAWTAWAWLLVCLVAEIGARVSGRPPARLPASRHAQAFAALLVGASIAILPSVRAHPPMRIAGASLGPQIHQIATVAYESPDSLVATTTEREVARAGSSVSAQATPESSRGYREYVVQPGDTLWSIAKRELGSPLRWKEIAALNVGEQQVDGKVMLDAGWILPGWVLYLPRASEHRADLSRDGATLRPTSQREPNVSTRSVPAPSTTPKSRERGESEAGVDGPGAREGRGAANAANKQSISSSDDSRNIPFAPFGYGLLGAGVVMILNRLRRAQQRHRPTGLRIALPPDQDLVDAEQLLRSSADHETADWVDAALRTLVASCRRSGRAAPNVVAVRILEKAVELIVGPSENPQAVAAPFEVSGDGTSWILPRRAELLEEAHLDPWVAGMEVMTPALVTIGREPRGLLLIDVEQAGSISVSGAGGDDALRAMAIELATSRWAEQVNVVLVGMEQIPRASSLHTAHLDVLDRFRTADNLVEVLPELRHISAERSLMLGAVGLDRTSEARMVMSGDGWDLTVVLCASRALETGRKAASELVALAGDGSHGLAVVCSGAQVGANWHLETGNGPMTISMAGLPETMVWPQRLDRNAGEQIARLVEVAQHFEGVAPSGPPYDSFGPREGVELVGDDEPPPTIEIRVLGPVEVVGAARPFTRAWSLELVVYLAMHPGGASSDQWSTHLWPSRSMAQASLHSTASAARRALGSAANGEDHLPRSHGRLTLGPGVSTDWDKFRRFAGSEDPGAWRRALDLIRGRPFDGLRSTDWAVFSHVQANIESVVVDVSVRRAEFCLEASDSAGAEWAARQGLLVSPYDERLFRLRMRAADLAGNPAGVEAVMGELLQLVGDEVEPFDSVHPETYELYRTLSRRNIPARPR